jgi:hypothetical protein
MHHSLGRPLAVFATLLFAAGTLDAQVPLTPRSLGTADAYIGIARGQESLWTNPANLALRGGPAWSLTIGQVAIAGTTVGPGFEDFANVLLLDEASESDFQNLLDLVPASGMQTRWNANLPLASLQVGRFALGISATGVARQTIDRDVLELLVDGYEDGRYDYSFGNSRGSHAAFLAVSAAYGRSVGPVAVGLTGRYLDGRASADYGFSDPRFNLGTHEIEVDLTGASSDAGRGFSVDIGAAMEPIERLTVSAVLGNAIGSLTWGDRYHHHATLTERDFDGGWEGIFDRYRDSRDLVADAEVAAFHDSQLPTTFTAGAAYAPWSGARVGGSYRMTVREGAFAGPWTSAAGIGIQQRLAIIGLRGGYATNLDGGTMISAGINLGPLEVGVAQISDDSTEGENGWIATTGLQVRGPIRR